MRCPKCHYISYDSVDRCRNCGYEFSLAVDTTDMELPIQTGDEPIGPLTDFPLADPQRQMPAATPAPPREPPPSRHVRSARGLAAARRSATELPLFKDRSVDNEAPLVSAPATPRAPLAVRRANAVAPRPSERAPDREPVLNLTTADESWTPAERESDVPPGPAYATAGRRLAAAVVDAVVLGSIDAVVLYLTLRVCGFSLVEIVLLPPVPLLSFVLLLDGGYLAAFTAAGGQTIGKMAAGIKVVSVGEDDRIRVRDAVVRSAAYLIFVLPAGLGCLPALVGPDRRTVHDRLAATRVIKA
jgi:uncharacterized RDD family membrane protein YckC